MFVARKVVRLVLKGVVSSINISFPTDVTREEDTGNVRTTSLVSPSVITARYAYFVVVRHVGAAKTRVRLKSPSLAFDISGLVHS
jgi:hypothetical protein